MEVTPAQRSKRVLVSRAAKQSSALADLLAVAGYEPVILPAIELTEPTTFAPLDAALAGLNRFDWLVFTSANAVRVFATRYAQGSLPTALRLAAIGPSTAAALTEAGLATDLVPPQAVAESLAAALLPQARHPDGRPTRFLLIRAEAARDHLPDTLRAAGAEVVIAPAYRTVVAADSIPQVRELFADTGHWPDAITFTSASTVRNLLVLLENAGIALPQQILRISIGPITSQALRDEGIPADTEAGEATLQALVQAVTAAFSSRQAANSNKYFS